MKNLILKEYLEFNKENEGKEVSAVDFTEWFVKRNSKKFLVDFFLFFRENGFDYLGYSIEELAEQFLKQKYENN